MQTEAPVVAVLDDEPEMRKAIRRLLGCRGFSVHEYESGEQLLTALNTAHPDCLLLDLHMPGLSGFEVLERISAQHVPVLVITGHDQPGNAERVRELGGVGYLLKPVNEVQLLQATRAAIECPLKTIVPSA